MWNIHHEQPKCDCDGISRRSFLRVGGLGFGGLSLPQLLAARAAGADSANAKRDTSVVWLWLNGGPSQIENFDPKITAPVEYRSVSGEVSTSVPMLENGTPIA